ncbi:MAG TPA: hypothetical protein VMF53_03880 [Alphaproteobacteria bacterium]|nr:hypothetical protein [Alphaproteobacteria bacterium]
MAFGLAFAAASFLWGAGSAAAFTIEHYSSGGDGQNLVDPDESAPIQKLTDPSGTSGYSNGSGVNFLGGHMNFSMTGHGAQPDGQSPAYGTRNYFDPSQSPVSPSVGFTNGPFGMFGGRP